jgi:simple sugar transport system permease protein
MAGAIEISGVLKRLDPHSMTTELGYTGIVVAAVARFNCLGVIPVAVLLAAIVVSGGSLQRLGIPPEIVFLLQGLIFLFVAAGEFFLANKVTIVSTVPVQPDGNGGLVNE